MPGIINLCLSFISLQGSQAVHVPEHIRQLTEKRILAQVERVLPTYVLGFTKNECPNVVDYFFDSQNIILLGDNEVWAGRLQASLTDVLDGRRLPLENHIRVKQENFTPTNANVYTKKKTWLPWVWGTLGFVAASSAILYFHNKNQNKSNRPGIAETPLNPTEPSSPSPLQPQPLSF